MIQGLLDKMQKKKKEREKQNSQQEINKTETQTKAKKTTKIGWKKGETLIFFYLKLNGIPKGSF